MGFPRTYAVGGEAAIATYDYVDISEGTGVIDFKGFATVASGATTHVLSRNATYSNGIESSAAITNTDTGVKATYNFDLSPFNLPQTIKGTSYTNVTLGGSGKDTSNAYAGYLTLYVQKVSPLTTLGTAISEQKTGTSNPGGKGVGHTLNVPMTLTETHFKKGEVLRLKVETHGWAVAPATVGIIGIGHDPQNRVASGGIISQDEEIPSTTKLDFYCPFKLDL